MKTQTLLRSCQLLALGILAAGTMTTGYAGLQIPYTPDADTIHLWHFDGAFTNANGTTNILTPDEVATGGMTLTNLAQTQVPGSTVTLGNPSAFSQLTNSLHIIPTNILAGNTYAFAYAGTNPVAAFVNASSGAFTYEAIIKMDGNPASNPSGVNYEIICGDGNINGNANRGWQFRIQCGPTPSLNFNAFPGNNAAVNNLVVNLPGTGPNAVAAGQWYHVAVTFTGGSPTNTDTAGVFTFYWTLLDANRTHADALSQINVQAGFGLAVAAGIAPLGVGGSGRANNGVGNNEGLKGYLDEARISVVARKSNEMAFIAGGTLNPPSFSAQPPTNTFIGYGQTLSLATLVSGTLPISFQWQQNRGGGYTNVAGQTDSTLTISNLLFSAAGDYRLIATNSLGGATSTVAQVTIGAAFSELFPTGVDTNGALPLGGPGVVDPHYTLIQSSDANNLGPNTIIWDMNVQPILAAGGRFANIDNISQWIGPLNNNYSSPSGIYVYRTRFLIDSTDINTATLQGIWWINTAGIDIRINGQSTGHANSIPRINAAPFVITATNGLVAGLNTLDFVLTNDVTNIDPQSAVRVEMSGLGQALAPGLPDITTEPANQTVRDGAVSPGSVATFSVVALGRPPLSYQWWADDAPVTAATNRSLTFLSPTTGAQGTNFQVVVSNDSGSVTSQVAVLTLVSSNQIPIAPGYSFTIYANGTLNVDASTLYQNSSDPDGDPISISFDVLSTNLGSVTPAGVLAVYAPVLDYTGADQFNYYIADGQGGNTPGPININILPLLSPTVSSVALAGGNVVLSGAGGAAGGGFHVLSSTNLTIPLANWTVVSAGTFDGGGNFSVTNAITPGVPQNFYILQVP